MTLLEASKKHQHDLGNYIFKLYLNMEKQKRVRAGRRRLVKILAGGKR